MTALVEEPDILPAGLRLDDDEDEDPDDDDDDIDKDEDDEDEDEDEEDGDEEEEETWQVGHDLVSAKYGFLLDFGYRTA